MTGLAISTGDAKTDAVVSLVLSVVALVLTLITWVVKTRLLGKGTDHSHPADHPDCTEVLRAVAELVQAIRQNGNHGSASPPEAGFRGQPGVVGTEPGPGPENGPQRGDAEH